MGFPETDRSVGTKTHKEIRNVITDISGSRVMQQSKALYLSARGVTTDLGSIPGWITTGHDRAAHNWLGEGLVGIGCHCKIRICS
jgi:hypothetical protein